MKISSAFATFPIVLAATAILAPCTAFTGDLSSAVPILQTGAMGQRPKPNAAPSTMPKIDDAAMALLLKSQTVMANLKTYSAESTMAVKVLSMIKGEPPPLPPVTVLTIVASARPNLVRMEAYTMVAGSSGNLTKQSGRPTWSLVSDGKTTWRQQGENYSTIPLVSPHQLEMDQPWGGFHSESGSPYGDLRTEKANGEIIEVRGVGTETIEGVICKKVLVHLTINSAFTKPDQKTTWYIGPDNLVRREVSVCMSSQFSITQEFTIRNIKTDEPIRDGAVRFAYTPPKGVTASSPQP